MTVAILGRVKWEWGKGDIVVILIGDRYFSQCEEAEDMLEAEGIAPEVAADLLTRKGVRLTEAGRKWMREQRAVWWKFQTMERRKNDTQTEG